jgi:hypothetical protein
LSFAPWHIEAVPGVQEASGEILAWIAAGAISALGIITRAAVISAGVAVITGKDSCCLLLATLLASHPYIKQIKTLMRFGASYRYMLTQRYVHLKRCKGV